MRISLTTIFYNAATDEFLGLVKSEGPIAKRKFIEEEHAIKIDRLAYDYAMDTTDTYFKTDEMIG